MELTKVYFHSSAYGSTPNYELAVSYRTKIASKGLKKNVFDKYHTYVLVCSLDYRQCLDFSYLCYATV